MLADLAELVPGAESLSGLERYAWARELAGQLMPYVPDFEAAERVGGLSFAARDGRTYTAGLSICFDNAHVSPYVDAARELVATTLAESLAAQGDRIVAALALDAAIVREVAKRLSREPRREVFLAATSSEGTQVVIARGESATLDCGAALKTLAAKAGGRGGGRPQRAEGRLPAGIDWTTLVAEL